jgi:hypothetical protein
MFDLFCVALVIGFFALAVLFVHGLDRLAKDEEESK